MPDDSHRSQLIARGPGLARSDWSPPARQHRGEKRDQQGDAADDRGGPERSAGDDVPKRGQIELGERQSRHARGGYQYMAGRDHYAQARRSGQPAAQGLAGNWSPACTCPAIDHEPRQTERDQDGSLKCKAERYGQQFGHHLTEKL